jgi:acyl-CoA reductase-like NAD-dependent aldehyde dehydrogenase
MTTLAIHNPANGELITTCPQTTLHRWPPRPQRARAAPSPPGLPRRLAERKACIERFRAGVVRDLESLAATMTRETGKPDQDVAQRAQRPARAHRLLPEGTRCYRWPLKPSLTTAA